MVLVSIPVCLFFLSILMVSGPYLTLSALIIICTSLHLRCLLSDIYDNLFNIVIMLSPLISRMLIYIFLLLNIIIFYNLFGKICHISEKFYLFGLAMAPRVLTVLTKPILFLYQCKCFNIVICLDDILVLVQSKWADRMKHLFLCFFISLP